ncbi:MAG: GYD domain-containing protein [SAR324 cluster bacterium]|nr:GYD domain-containing protein [SAR324 cluster bacterium]
MYKTSYTTQATKAMVDNPQDRSGIIAKACESFGGKLIGMYMAFGNDDVVGIAELPNDIAAAAISAQIASGGAASSVSTTQLLSMNDWVKACESAKAVSSGYAPPS